LAGTGPETDWQLRSDQDEEAAVEMPQRQTAFNQTLIIPPGEPMSIVGPQRLMLRGWGTADSIFLSAAQVHGLQVLVIVLSGGSGMLPMGYQKSSATADQLS
jgi:hypothetical protein